MFIGHFPAAYIIAKATRAKTNRGTRIGFLVGSVLPDIDILWFYLVDARQHHHHNYITHKPALWFVVFLVGFLLRSHKLGRVAIAVGLGGLLHMGLDSIVGQVTWAWPISAFAQPLVTVPATQSWWVMSFVLHWTFAVEIVLILFAFLMWRRART